MTEWPYLTVETKPSLTDKEGAPIQFQYQLHIKSSDKFREKNLKQREGGAVCWCTVLSATNEEIKMIS